MEKAFSIFGCTSLKCSPSIVQVNNFLCKLVMPNYFVAANLWITTVQMDFTTQEKFVFFILSGMYWTFGTNLCIYTEQMFM